MISEKSIQEVMDRADIADIIGEYTTLKKQGARLTGLCPLHDEKSPSFTVTPSKDMYKCFGCGSGGSLVTFLMEKENMDYPEVMEVLAKRYGITLEREGKEKTPEEKITEHRLNTALKAAMRLYQKELHALPPDAPVWKELKENRCLTDDIISDFQIGWAPDAWGTLKDKVIESGYWGECEKLGLVKNNNGKNYDTIRNRIVFPILDHKGNLVGYAGRYLGYSEEIKKQGIPKYKNSHESALFDKSAVLYGLFQSKKEIVKQGFAYLVEGQFDVTALHMAGVCNVVATGGTALSERQVRLLKRFCSRVVIMRDNDKAGQAAAMKDMAMLLQGGFAVDVCVLPDGQDPDEFVRSGVISEDMI